MLGDNAAVYIIRRQCNDAKFQMEKMAMKKKSTMISSYT